MSKNRAATARAKSATTETPGIEPRDALTRAIEMSMHDSKYRPITIEEAEELTRHIVEPDNDVQIYAFIRLLYGLVASHYGELHKAPGEPPKFEIVECLTTAASAEAYKVSFHFNDAVGEFAMLDWNKERDLRLLRREFTRKAEGKEE